MNSSSGHLAFQCQSESGLPPPSLCPVQSAEGSAFGLKMATAVPHTGLPYNPTSIIGGATGPDQLLMLRMLAQQQSTSGAEGSARGPGIAAGLSMLPSPLPLDLNSTGVQPQLGGLAYSAPAPPQQHLLRFGLHQPQMQYGAHPHHLQYHTMQHQLQSASQQLHVPLQFALQQQQQQVPEQSLVEQVMAAAAAAPQAPPAPPAPQAPPASAALLQTAGDQLQPQKEQQQQQQPVPVALAATQGKQQDRQAEAVQQQPPPQQQIRQDQGTEDQGHRVLSQQPQQQQQFADTPAAGGDADAQDLGSRDAPEPLSATGSGDTSGQPGSAAGLNPGGTAAGAAGAAAAAAAAAKGSKYGAKRAAALKRQGYSNSVPGPNGNGKSNFRGVFWDRKNSRWRAQVGFNNRKIFMGYFGEPAEAARAYDKKVVQLHGALAKTNFPLEEYAEDLRAFNQQQQEQQLMVTQQTSVMHRPRRVRRRQRFNSDTSDGSEGAADDEHMDTDVRAGAASHQSAAALTQAGAGMYPQGPSGYGGAVPPASSDAPPHLCQGGAGVYGQGPVAGYMGGYPAQMPAGVATVTAAAAAAVEAPGVGMLQQMFSAAKPAAAGADLSASELSADVAAAVAAAAALVGASTDQQQHPAAAAAEHAVGLKRKRSADGGAGEATDAAEDVNAAGVEASACGPPEAAIAKDPAAVAAATKAQPVDTASGLYSEQLPPLIAADPWQSTAWVQQQQQQGNAALPPRPFSGSRRQYSWHGSELEGGTAAAAAAPLQRQYSGSHRQYSWPGDDVVGGASAGRALSPPAWLPTPPPHLTWQDHMKNLEASLVNAGKRDTDKDIRDKDSNRDSNTISPHRAGNAAAGGGGYYRTGGSKPSGKTPQAYAGRWQHLLADLAAAEAGDAPGKQRRKGGWQQPPPADTDSLSALLAVAAAAEAGDSENPDAGADALAGLLSIAAAAGASNPAAAARLGASEEAQVMLTKEQEQEWLALTSALAAALTGAADPPPAGFSEGQTVTAELLTAIRILAQRGAAAAAGAQQQFGGAAGNAEVGLPFEILSTVEQWMLDHADQQAAAAAAGADQPQRGAGYAMDSEVSIAEALACASEAGIPAEVRQMYLLVLHHVLCKKEQQLGQQLHELGGTQAKQHQQHEGVAAQHDDVAMKVDDAAVAAARRQPEAVAAASEPRTAGNCAVGMTAAQQQQQQAKAALPAAGSDERMQQATLAAPSTTAAHTQAASTEAPLVAAATAETAATCQPLLPEQVTVGGVIDAATAAAMPVAAFSKGAVPPAVAAALLPSCGDQQQSHIAAATLVAEPGLADTAATGRETVIGLGAVGTAEPTAAAGVGGSLAVAGVHDMPDAGGGMSRWGSGTEGVMDVCQG